MSFAKPNPTDVQGDSFSAGFCAFQHVAVDGGMLNVASCGDGPPLMLLHGWTLDHRIWQPQLDSLATHYRLIMPDRRGFGRSTADADLGSELADIDQIARHFGLQSLYVLGMSQGGALAIAYASSRPDMVRALVTLGAPLVGIVPGEDRFERQRWSTLIREGRIAEMRSEWLAHPLMHGLQGAARRLVEEIVEDYAGQDLLLQSSLPTISEEQLGKLGTPLLALAGAGDTAWRISVARFLADAAPKGRFEMVADAGHLANVDNPDRFNAQVLQFLRSVDSF